CASPLTCGPQFPRGFGAIVAEAAGRAVPIARYGDALLPGRNAFARNRRAPLGANFFLNVPLGSASAIGNQWEQCGAGMLCNAAAVLANAVRLADGASVDVADPPDPRAEIPVISAVSPARPKAGTLVRVFGEGFNAIDGTGCVDEPAPADPCSGVDCAVEAA